VPPSDRQPAAPRPPVDVVVPFAGDAAALAAALGRLAALDRGPRDTVLVADNRPPAASAVPSPPPGVRVLPAGARRGSYFARNTGAAAGTNPWIVFLDADVEPAADLLDRLFDPPPGERCAVLGGRVTDAAPGPGAGPAVRFAHAVALMSQDRTLERPAFAYVQTACCAVRRSAFAAVGGFRGELRSGGDADLCFRLRDAGWTLETRPAAAVVHRSRTTTRALLRQRVRVGAGARWLEEHHPGFAPRRPLARALAGDARQAARGLAVALRGDREAGLLRALQGAADAAFVIGWRLPNRAGRR